MLWIHPICGRIEPAGEPPSSQTGDGLIVSSLRQSRDVSFIRVTLARGQGRASVDTVLASIKGVAEHSWVAEDTAQVAMAQGVGSSEVLRRLARGSIELREVREMGNTLEDVFLSAVDEEKEANQG